jgi:carboxypeptidase Q
MINSLVRRGSLCAMLLLAGTTLGQDAPQKALDLDTQILKNAQDNSEIMKNLQYLSDVIGPRLTGSANLKRANEWGAEVMKKYGLSNVHLEPWEIPTGWERGTATMKLIDPDNGRSLTVAAAGWSPSTKGKITGDVVILQARNKEDLEKYRGKLKNAIVLSREPSRVAPITDLSYGPGGGGPKKDAPKDGAKGHDAKAPKEKEPETKKEPEPKKASEATEAPKDKDPNAKDPEPKKERKNPAMKGGEGFMAFRRELSEFLRSEGVAVMLNDSGKPHNLLVTTGSWRGEDRANSPEPLPSLYVSHEHYALLYRLASRPDAKTRVEVEITNTFVPGPVTVYNTVGEIPGEKADEFVVIGAHLDSWDLAQGTTDNGTGSCVVLEAARLIAKTGIKPKRTIRFVLFTGEEQGLHGSKQYVKRHEAEMAKTSVALVHDTGTGKVQGFGLQGREAIKPIMDRELVSLKNIGFNGVSLRGMGGTDHLSFEAVGVPGFACDQDMDEYRLTHHTPSDTFDKAKEPNLIQGAQVMAITALRVANLPELLPRDKPMQPKGGRRRPDAPPASKEGPATTPKEALSITPRVVTAK